jgi:hypothetical protein
VPPYHGYASLVGSSIWLIAGTGTLTTAVVGWKLFQRRLSDCSTYRVIVLGGIIGFVMALDDILLFHDEYADYFGIPEVFFPVFYLICIIILIVYSRKVFGLTPWLLFFSSLVCFGLSVILDDLGPRMGIDSRSEDVFKICGIVLWAFYFLRVSWDFIAAAGEPSNASSKIEK